jgi:hypothetical protein
VLFPAGERTTLPHDELLSGPLVGNRGASDMHDISGIAHRFLLVDGKEPRHYGPMSKARLPPLTALLLVMSASLFDVGAQTNTVSLTEAQFNAAFREGRLAGRADVTGNPSRYKLFTRAEYNANFRAGRMAGRADVNNNPTAYGLLARADVPPVRFDAARGTALTVSVPGNWTRFARSGVPQGWVFDATTGELSGKMPSRDRNFRIIPYAGLQAGPPMTIQLRPAEVPSPPPPAPLLPVISVEPAVVRTEREPAFVSFSSDNVEIHVEVKNTGGSDLVITGMQAPSGSSNWSGYYWLYSTDQSFPLLIPPNASRTVAITLSYQIFFSSSFSDRISFSSNAVDGTGYFLHVGHIEVEQ